MNVTAAAAAFDILNGSLAEKSNLLAFLRGRALSLFFRRTIPSQALSLERAMCFSEAVTQRPSSPKGKQG